MFKQTETDKMNTLLERVICCRQDLKTSNSTV